jgi:hypothetical protein
MSILAITVTTVSCDGAHGRACPERATAVYHHPLSIASRLARQAGWELDIDAACPRCQRSSALAVITSAIPVIQVLRAA